MSNHETPGDKADIDRSPPSGDYTGEFAENQSRLKAGDPESSGSSTNRDANGLAEPGNSSAEKPNSVQEHETERLNPGQPKGSPTGAAGNRPKWPSNSA